MEKFYSQDTLVGIKVSNFSSGTNPVTDNGEALQIITLKHAMGTIIKIHAHKPQQRITQKLQECLIVKKGKVKIELYRHNKLHVADIILNTGELFILLDGIWAVQFLEDSEIIETKNGPYKDDKIAIEL